MARCSFCNKKMGIIEFDCKCEKQFCVKCRHPQDHKCTYDYKNEQKIKLSKDLVNMTPEKIIKIIKIK